MSEDFQVLGNSNDAPFSLKVHRGDGMCLLSMDWHGGKPPDDFVGFAIEYRPPDSDRFFAVKNRLSFPGARETVPDAIDPRKFESTRAPFQKFRWVHFPRDAKLRGISRYRVTPVFMNERDETSIGDATGGVAATGPQDLSRQDQHSFLPGLRVVAGICRPLCVSRSDLDPLPAKAAKGLAFKPTHPKTDDALAWMGFESRRAVIDTLDAAIADKTAQVRMVVYDLNMPEIVERIEKLGPRLKVIIDDSKEHGEPHSAESEAANRLAASIGAANVRRQHMKQLQHNKMIVVDGDRRQDRDGRFDQLLVARLLCPVEQRRRRRRGGGDRSIYAGLQGLLGFGSRFRLD